MTGRPVRARIVVVGDLATDVVARYAGSLQFGSDTRADIATYGGGSAGNVTAWLAATGVPAVFICRVGNDDAGRGQVARLTDAGVDVRVSIDPCLATGAVVVLVDSEGERTMLPDRGANAALAPSDLPPEVFAKGGHLHLSGYPLLHESSRPAAQAALTMARSAGMTSSVDPSSVAPLRDAGADLFMEWTRGTDLCIANLDEARLLAGLGSPADIAKRLATSTYGEVVIKCGAAGAVWSDGSAVESVPAAPTQAMDSTGAGDAFAAGFLARWTADVPAVECLRAGALLAAKAVGRSGGRPD